MHLATLTRTDLTDAVVRELGLGRSDCAKLVERVLALACEALERGEEVKLSGFGVFEVRSKAARMGRNPKTGEPANIVPRRVMTFRASQLLKGRIAAGHAARAQRDAAPCVVPHEAEPLAAKGPEAFRSISEASAELGVAPHVLRFWETRFSFIRPMTRSGGRRFYRPQDLDVLRGVRALLHDEGYSIKGVQRLHREEGVARLVSAGAGQAAPVIGAGPALVAADLIEGPRPTLAEGPRRALHDVLADLERTKARIDRLLASAPPQS